MIAEFLLPIIGWFVLFVVCFVVYSFAFYKEKHNASHAPIEGQTLFTAVTAFFWVAVYFCLSSLWSVLYSLIDLKFPDEVIAASTYAYSSAGALYDTFAFPLAMILVSTVTVLLLTVWLTWKINTNENLRPEKLYSFMRLLVYIGGTIMTFFGFVYIVYSWLYGNLPIAVFMKAGIALLIVGLVALYFYLTENSNKTKNLFLSRIFAGVLFVATVLVLVISFKIIGTPAQARLYRLDAITLQNVQNVKQEIDNQDQNFGNKISDLKEITSEYARTSLKQTPMTYTTSSTTYTICADFKSNMPATVNIPNKVEDWDYSQGNSCFTFPHLKTYSTVDGQAKPVFVK